MFRRMCVDRLAGQLRVRSWGVAASVGIASAVAVAGWFDNVACAAPGETSEGAFSLWKAALRQRFGRAAEVDLHAELEPWLTNRTDKMLTWQVLMEGSRRIKDVAIFRWSEMQPDAT